MLAGPAGAGAAAAQALARVGSGSNRSVATSAGTQATEVDQLTASRRVGGQGSGRSRTFELTEVHDEFKSTGRPDKKGTVLSPSFATDILMHLTADKVRLLRTEFRRKDDGLTLHEFVFVMKTFLGHALADNSESPLKSMSDGSLVANLCELFAQIDVNGDGTLEWEEFTSFIVDMSMHTAVDEPTSIQSYHVTPFLDLSKHASVIDKLSFFPDINRFACVEHGADTVKFFDTSCELVNSIARDQGAFLCVDHIPEHDHLVLSSSDLQMSFYDSTTYKLQKCFHAPSSQLCLSWSPKVRTLYSAGVSGVVYAWDAELMEEKHHMGGLCRDGSMLKESHEDIVLQVLPMPSLDIVASASMDRTIRLWDINTGKSRKVLSGHTKGVRCLAYSEEFRFLISAGFDYDALVWNPYVEKLILPLHGHNSPLCGITVIPDTPQIITADTSGIFKLWDIRNFACVQTFSNDDVDELHAFVSVPESRRIIAGGKRLHIFDYEKQENPTLTDDNTIVGACYNPTSHTFLTVGTSDVKLWSATTGELQQRNKNSLSSDLTCMVLDDRERKYILGSHSGEIAVYDYMNGSIMKSLYQHAGEVTAMVYCARDKSVLSVSRDNTIVVVDEMHPEKGILLKEIINGHSADITCVAFSPFLNAVATASSDGTLVVWNYEFCKGTAYCIGHTSTITCVAFLEPYPLLVSADSNGNVCFWGLRPSAVNGRCVCRLVNKHVEGMDEGGDTHCPVLSLAIRDEGDSKLMYTGDDKGFVKVWNLDAMLESLESKGVNALDAPLPCSFPRRNVRTDAGAWVATVQATPEREAFLAAVARRANFFAPRGYPLVGASEVTLVRWWKAHQDTVFSVQITSEPPAVVTTSFDRHVKVWSVTGTWLGTLQQGGHRQPWAFRADVEAKVRRMDELAAATLELVEEKIPEEDKQRLQNALRPQPPKSAPKTGFSRYGGSRQVTGDGRTSGTPRRRRTRGGRGRGRGRRSASMRARSNEDGDVDVLRTQGYFSEEDDAEPEQIPRHTPRLAPITAKNAGRPNNSTLQGVLARTTSPRGPGTSRFPPVPQTAR